MTSTGPRPCQCAIAQLSRKDVFPLTVPALGRLLRQHCGSAGVAEAQKGGEAVDILARRAPSVDRRGRVAMAERDPAEHHMLLRKRKEGRRRLVPEGPGLDAA